MHRVSYRVGRRKASRLYGLVINNINFMNKKTYCAGLFAVMNIATVHVSAQDNTWVELATAKTGLDTAHAFNVYVADINNDHYPDLVTLKGDWAIGSEDALRVYMNVKDPQSSDPSARTFADVTALSGVNVVPASMNVSRGTIMAAFADINNDGNVDMVRGHYYHRMESFKDSGDRCEILLGDGMGRFTLVADGFADLGLVNATGFSFLDYDKDGNIDLFIATWFKDYHNDVWDHGYLMKGNGDGTFTNMSVQAGITQTEPMYGCSVVDWNNDGWPDIATGPYCRTRGQLWKNNGNGTFTNVAVSANYNARYMQGDAGQNLCLWNPVPEDFDNDGDMDFFFSLVHGGTGANEGRSAIMVNSGAGGSYKLDADRDRITRKNPQSSHLGDYDASWFDLDNDGLMDLLMGQGYYSPPMDRLYVFRQDQDHSFMDITGDIGLVGTETRDIHSLEVLDYDLDGDDDMITCRDGQPRLFNLIENRIGQDNNWIGVSLFAPQGVNKSSIGARVYVWSGGVQRMREVYAGRGNNGGQQPFSMLFGLGNNTVIDSLRIAWPDAAGSITAIKNPPVNQYLGITINGLSVDDELEANVVITLKIYPNPARDFILVQMSDNSVPHGIFIYDMTGRMVERFPVHGAGEATRYCSVASLPAGHYIVAVTGATGTVHTQSFVKH